MLSPLPPLLLPLVNGVQRGLKRWSREIFKLKPSGSSFYILKQGQQQRPWNASLFVGLL